MTLICCLPDEYKSLSQSLMLLDDLKKSTIRKAFLTEETNSRKRGEQHTSDLALFSSNASTTKQECDFCGLEGHTSFECQKLISACAWACKPRPPRKQNANSTTNKPETKIVTESAGNASVNHISFSPLQTNANFNWNTDSGTTFHMAPHAHWICSYRPFQTPIHLANNLIVYSAGIGSVVFGLVIGGKERRVVEFTRVLHVPDLRTNLLSILY